jgi:catechol 2,3-dioxygenase
MTETQYGIAPAKFRLTGDLQLGPVRLQVGDLERSLAYYRDTLGLRVTSRDARAAALAPHGDDTVLVELHARPGVTPVPHGGVLGLYHFAILLPDRAALGRFAAHIATRGVRVGMADHDVSEAFYLTDPDGLGIEVYADRPRTAWRYEGRQLYMTTKPLDVRSVVEAGGSQPWTGMPRGTVIGHVHLHVGDLDEAASFYHSTLGFDKVVWNYPGALFLSASGYHHHLGTNTWSSGPPAADDQARLLSWDIVVADREQLRAAVESLQAAGRDVRQEGDAWRVADPWGTTVRLRTR